MITILEYLWQEDRMMVLRLLGLAFLGGRVFEEIIHEPAPKIVAPSPFEKLMRHDAYRRGKGGAIRQVRWA